MDIQYQTFQIMQKAQDRYQKPNMYDSCLNYKQFHLNKKGNSYMTNNFLDYHDCE